MKNRLEGSKTFTNLINAFAGESQARNRYTFFAKIAKKEGFEQIGDIFLTTADNEKEHAKLFYKFLGNGICSTEASYPFFMGNTLENLKFAADGEHDEWANLYENSSIVAKQEGFDDIANTFKQIAEVEKHHENRYRALARNIDEGVVFNKYSDVEWICINCGRTYFSQEAPLICPTCHHPQAFFELLCENY